MTVTIQDEITLNAVELHNRILSDGDDISKLELIHGLERQQDGYIGFCSKVNDKHHDLAGVRIDRLREYLPGILDFILEDSYFTVNASYKVKPYKSKLTGLPAPERQEIYLRYLNATYADLDFYKAGGLDWGDMLAIIAKAQDAGRLPPASIIGRSGRGAYLLWLLTSERQGAQQRAFPEEIQTYKQINKAIIERLDAIDKRLGADHIYDAARILRIPGSTNTKAQQKVEFIIQVVKGTIPVYTLNALSCFFGLPPAQFYQIIHDDSFFGRAIKSRGSCPRRRLGREASAKYRLLDITTISAHIGGFPQGRRRKLLIKFVQIAKTAGYPYSKIFGDLKGLAAQCRPPYPSDPNDIPLQKLMDEIWLQPTRRFLNWKLAKDFDVTPEMAEELQLRSIVPETVQERRKEQISEQEQKRNERRAAIKEILEDSPAAKPSLRRMLALLSEQGIETNIETIRKDMKENVKIPLH